MSEARTASRDDLLVQINRQIECSVNLFVLGIGEFTLASSN